jgi:hypothetical protein
MTLEQREEINLRKYMQLFALICFFSIVITPAVFTPLVADDFIISVYSNYVIEDSWWQVTYGAFAQSLGGTHFTVLNALLSGYWLKIWLSLSQELHLNLHFGFWFAKAVVYILWFFALRYFVFKTLHLKVNRNRIDFVLVLSFATVLQIHTLWSNDPVTNYVFAGFLPVAFALVTLAKYFEYSLDPTFTKMLSVSIFSLASLLFYEINFALVPVFFLVAIIGLRSRSPFKYKYALLRLMPAIFTVISFVLLRTYTGKNANAYEGTTILLGFNSIRSFLINLAGAFPTSTWPIASRLEGLYFSVPLLFIVVLLLYFVGYFHKTCDPKYNKKSSASVLVNKESLVLCSLVIWGFGAIAIQSLTPKIQTEVNVIGKVYTSYATSASVVTILIASLILQKIDTKNKIAMTFFLLLAAAQITLNFALNAKIWDVMNPNVRLISVATSPTDSVTRCKALNQWLEVNWPPYYSAGTVRGLNVYSESINDEPFCESPKN